MVIVKIIVTYESAEMDCYKMLNDGSKRSLAVSFTSFTILLIHAVYSIIIKALGSSWLPIPIIVLDLLFIIGLIVRMWVVVYTDDSSMSIDSGFFVGVFIFLYCIGCYSCVLVYTIQSFTSHTDAFLPQEFIIVVPYLLILGITVVWGVCMGCYWFYTIVIDTCAIMKARSSASIRINDTSNTEATNFLESGTNDLVPSESSVIFTSR